MGCPHKLIGTQATSVSPTRKSTNSGLPVATWPLCEASVVLWEVAPQQDRPSETVAKLWSFPHRPPSQSTVRSPRSFPRSGLTRSSVTSLHNCHDFGDVHNLLRASSLKLLNEESDNAISNETENSLKGVHSTTLALLISRLKKLQMQTLEALRHICQSQGYCPSGTESKTTPTCRMSASGASASAARLGNRAQLRKSLILQRQPTSNHKRA